MGEVWEDISFAIFLYKKTEKLKILSGRGTWGGGREMRKTRHQNPIKEISCGKNGGKVNPRNYLNLLKKDSNSTVTAVNKG